MTHEHNIIDDDKRFIIDAKTRAIIPPDEIPKLMRGDHNSQRFTFELPCLIEGHDMLSCDRIEVHYTNTSFNNVEKSKDVYIVSELHKDEEKGVAVFSWKISRNATKYAGTLGFRISFVCLDEDVVEYSLNTDECITEVKKGANNSQTAYKAIPDVLVAWEEKVVKNATDKALKMLVDSCVMWHSEIWFDVSIGDEVNIESYELIEYEERHESRTPQVGDIVWDANMDVYEITVVEPSGTLSIALRIPIDRLARDFRNLESDVIDFANKSCMMWHTHWFYDGVFKLGDVVVGLAYDDLNEYEERKENRKPQVNDIIWDDDGNMWVIIDTYEFDFKMQAVIPIDRMAQDVRNLERDVGNIDTALDNIISIQESLIGGNA